MILVCSIIRIHPNPPQVLKAAPYENNPHVSVEWFSFDEITTKQRHVINQKLRGEFHDRANNMKQIND
jgi:hypothetical protein